MSENHVWKALHLVARRLDLMLEVQRKQLKILDNLIQGIEEHNRLWRELTKEEKKKKRRRKRKNRKNLTYHSPPSVLGDDTRVRKGFNPFRMEGREHFLEHGA